MVGKTRHKVLGSMTKDGMSLPFVDLSPRVGFDSTGINVGLGRKNRHFLNKNTNKTEQSSKQVRFNICSPINGLAEN